jgi:PAS domain S-box-containing protein
MKIKTNNIPKQSLSNNSINDDVIMSVLQTLPVGVIIYNLKNILFANDSTFNHLNFDKKLKKGIVALSIFDFLLPEYHKLAKANIRQLLKGKTPNNLLFKLKNQKQEVFNIEVKSSIITFNGKKAVQATFIEINDRVEKFNDLEKTKETLNSLSKSIKDIIYEFVFIPKPHINYISDSVFDILGCKPHEIYKDKTILFNQIHPDDKKSLEASLNKYLKFFNTTKTKKEIVRGFHINGQQKLLEVTITPKITGNKTVSISGVIRDITKENNYHTELEQKWNNYKNLLDSSPIGIFIHEGFCIYGNKTAANILEIDEPKNLIGKYLIDFIIPEQRQKLLDRIQKALSGAEQTDLLYTIKTDKGNIIDVDLKTAPFVYNGKLVAQTIISDISAEKKLAKEIIRAELAEELNKKLIDEINYRKKIQNELTTQTNKYEAFFNNTTHLIWTINKELEITSFNNNYYKYVKSAFNHELKIGQHIKNVNKIVNSTAKFWIDKYTDFFKNKKDKQGDFFEVKNINEKGKTFYREIFLHPIRSTDGEIIEIAIIGHDTTERRLSEQKIIEQAAKLEAIFESGEQLNWTIDRSYFFTSFNKNFSDAMVNLYKVKPTLEKKIYKPHKTLIGIEYHNWWISKYDEAFKKGSSLEFTTEQYNPDKKKLYRQIIIHPIYKNGVVEELSCISNDITELRHLQNESINQAAKITSIFESSAHLIWTVTKDFKVNSFNKNFSKFFNHNNGIEPQLNTQLHKLLQKNKQAAYKAYWYPVYKKVFEGESVKLEREQLEINGEINYKEIYLSPIKNRSNEIIEIACLAHDISENKMFEKQIIEKSLRMKAIFESGNHLIWTVNKNLELTSYNKNYFNSIKNNVGKKNLSKNKIISVLDTIQNKERKVFWSKKYKSVLAGKPNVFIHKTINDNNEVYREIYLHPILLNNKVVEVSVIAQNITERVKSENKIIEQSAKLKAIFESGDQLMWTITKDLKLTSFNKNYSNAIFNLYGYYPQIGKSIRSDKSQTAHSLLDEKYALAFEGKKVEFISERTTRSGKKIIRQIILYPIKDSSNRVLEISGIGFDITENKINEEKITQSLKEKEILLKEVHHRVKNNMQVISSILNLQSSYVKDNYALNLLNECQNRIKSMAFIHESLYQSKNFESVNFSEYLAVLTKSLVHTYAINTKKIKLILTLNKLFLNLDLSIPCGLIINEIISNSLKYAFPNNRDGIIFVNLKVNKKNVKIEVGDNGVGIPEKLDIKNTQTLGLQLVNTLVEQLNGTVKLNRTKGTAFCIEFNI